MEQFLRDGGVDLAKISRVNAGDAHYFDDTTTPAKVRSYLDSSKEAEKLKGMKWLLAMVSKGRDVSEFFPFVVKNVVARSVEVKKMVYNYLVHFADFDNTCREIALLSINSFQKDLSGSNQLIRGLALRVMTSIRVSEITQIQLLAVKKCSTDGSPYVRKCAATALIKVFHFDKEQLEYLIPILEKLLNDPSTMVLGSAITAFNEICPTNYEILHPSYRKLCQLIADMDEWTQVVALEVMTRYCRTQFLDPAPGVAAAIRLQAKQRSTSAVAGRIGATIKRRVLRKAFYSDEEDESVEEEIEIESNTNVPSSVFANEKSDTADGDIDMDHRLVLRCTLPLLKSRNSSVVMGVASLHYYCGSQNSVTNLQIGKALVRILRNRREIQYIVLNSINTLAQERPLMFQDYLSDFFIKGSDPVFNRLLKLEILTALCTKETSSIILRELQTYVKHSDPKFVSATVRAVGRVVDVDPESATVCLEGLMHLLLCTKSTHVMGETVVVLRHFLQQNSKLESSINTLHKLVKLLIGDSQTVTEATARASIVWLVGEFHEVLANIAPDILRLLAKSFVDESIETKNQILNFAVKLSLRLSDHDNVQSLMQYVLEMARYDVDTDLRDRSRFMTALMGLAASGEDGATSIDEEALGELNEHAMGIMLCPKLPPVTLLGSVDVDGLPHFNLGSLSSIVGHNITGYKCIPVWTSEQPNPAARDKIQAASPFFSDNGQTDSKNAIENSRNDDQDFYGDESNSDDSDDSSDSDESSDTNDSDDTSDSDGSDDDSSNSEDSSSSSSSSSSSESEDEVAPIKQRRATSQGMKRVANNSGKNKGAESSLLPIDFENTPMTTTPVVQLNNNNGIAAVDDLSFLMGSTHVNDGNKSNATISASSSSTISNAIDSNDMFSVFDSLLDTSTPNANPVQHISTFGLSEELLSFSSSLPAPPATMMQNTNIASDNFAISKGEIESHSRILLKSELCSGLSLSINFSFGRSVPPSLPFASLITLTVRNSGDLPFRRLKINFPADVKTTFIKDIDILNSGAEIKIPIEAVLIGNAGKVIRIDVRSDKGSYVAMFTPSVEELLIPLSLTKMEFISARDKLGGFSESTKTFSLESLKISSSDIEDQITERLLKKTDVNVIQGPGQGEMMFAGGNRKPSGDVSKVLITVNSQAGGGQVKIKINCDEAVISSSLLSILK